MMKYEKDAQTTMKQQHLWTLKLLSNILEMSEGEQEEKLWQLMKKK